MGGGEGFFRTLCEQNPIMEPVFAFSLYLKTDHTQTLRELAESLVMLVVLFGLYFVFFKLIKWKNEHFRDFFLSLRPYVYFLICSFCLLDFFSDILVYEKYLTVFRILIFLFLFDLGIIAIRTVKYLLFDVFLTRTGGISMWSMYEQLFTGVLYALLAVVMVGSIDGFDITHVIATSAVISLVLGLALQDTLGNIFAGLALNLSRPYGKGDWVRVGDVEGQVRNVNWRSVSVLSSDGFEVILPNNVVSKAQICNYSRPHEDFLKIIYLNVSNLYEPLRIVSLLKSIFQGVDDIQCSPAPFVGVYDYGYAAVRYKMSYRLKDFSRSSRVHALLMERVWYVFERNRINVWGDGALSFDEEDRDYKKSLLRSNGILSSLGSRVLSSLAENSRKFLYGNGEIIYDGGDGSEFVYMPVRGTVLCRIRDEQNMTVLEEPVSRDWIFGWAVPDMAFRISFVAGGEAVVLAMAKEFVLENIESHESARKAMQFELARWTEVLSEKMRFKNMEKNLNPSRREEVLDLLKNFFKF